MKKIITKNSTLKIFFKSVFMLTVCFVTTGSTAQSWQWLKSGGNNSSGSGPDYSQRIQYMDSDPQGNVYFATNQFGSGNGYQLPLPFTISNYQVPHYSGYDAIVSSLDCTGALRWTVAIGGLYDIETPPNGYTSRQSAIIKDLKTDAQGNLYLIGIMSRGFNATEPFHFSPTFTVPNAPALVNEHKEQFFIAKYNTNGVVQWVRFPEGPNVATNNNDGRAVSIKMDVDPNGTLHVYSFFNAGVFCNGALTIANNATKLILKYDTNGNYIGTAAIQYSADDYFPFHFLHDPNLDRYYFAKNQYQPEVPTIIGGEVQNKTIIVAAFDTNGTFLWKKTDDNTNLSSVFNADFYSLSLDNESNLFLNCSLGSSFDSNFEIIGVNSWDGQPLTYPVNSEENLSSFVNVIKMNSNGDTLWIKSLPDGSGLKKGTISDKSSINGNQLAIALGMREFEWEGVPEVIIPGLNGLSPAMLRLNKDTGVGIDINYLNVGVPTFVPASNIAAAPNGGYYLAGGFGSTISINPDGSSPVYSTGGYDDFFIAKFGTSNCTLATKEVKDITPQLYPNPVASLLYLNNKELVTYSIYDALGKIIQMGTIDSNGSIDLNYLNKGFYLIQIKTESGMVTTEKILKK
jgi:Secretion system C-terminal sorting domain